MDDMKIVVVLILAFFILPISGMIVNDWHKQECRIELSKAGRTVEEIKELCK